MHGNRRKFLKLSSLAAVTTAAGGLGAFSATRTPQAALAPWREAGMRDDDPRRLVLSYAILAPNPHNLQPWLVRLDEDMRFTLYADVARKLPQTDPLDRQITIGLGCFLEIARQAAASLGLRMDTQLFPEGEPPERLDRRPVASVALNRATIAGDPLFQQVLLRRSCKAPFDMSRPPGAGDMRALMAAVPAGVRFGAAHEGDLVAALRDLGWRAHLVEMQTERTLRESIDLMRIGKAEIEANPDGIDIGGPMMDLLRLAGLISRRQMADPSSEAFRQGLDMYREMFDNTPAFAWLSTGGNTRAAQVRSGAAWVRLNLAATASGLGVHPVSQSLQEYPEMASLLEEVHTRLRVPAGHRIQMLGRVGFGPQTPPSPRWPLQRRIMSA